MEKTEIAEVLQAIDSCSQDNCSECPYYVKDEDTTCMQHMFAMAYSTIKSLTEEEA